MEAEEKRAAKEGNGAAGSKSKGNGGSNGSAKPGRGRPRGSTSPRPPSDAAAGRIKQIEGLCVRLRELHAGLTDVADDADKLLDRYLACVNSTGEVIESGDGGGERGGRRKGGKGGPRA